MRRASRLAMVCMAVLMFAGRAHAGPLFGVRNPSIFVGGDAELVTIDTITGAVTNVGSLGSSSAGALAFDSSGMLFGVDFSTDQLLSINTTTGAAANGVFVGSIENLAFDSSGTLFGVSSFGFGGVALVTINTATGAVTTIGSLSTGLGGITSLAFDSGDTLFGLDTPFFGLGDVQLVRVDANTGSATNIGPLLSPGFVQGLAFDSNGTLFGANISTGQLLTIDTTTGSATNVGPLGTPGISSLAFQPSAAPAAVPEPSSVILFGLGFVGIALGAARRHRDKQSV